MATPGSSNCLWWTRMINPWVIPASFAATVREHGKVKQLECTLTGNIKNGHITQPDVPPNKPTSGQVSVYATTQARDDDKFTAIHGQWTADKTGGDQRGLLLTSTPFDDGRCRSEIKYQNRAFG
ncbi:hypothetical protein PV11_03471 [Exophiala sideris]|uniref:DUF7492 domain-containing protein n=1 Tax=Exophiala sideris TaxID=1016849 RepID=A0A0D1YJU2_9EURO|nr:hypothetical protein PV11_03471 [Exophiala sideris]